MSEKLTQSTNEQNEGGTYESMADIESVKSLQDKQEIGYMDVSAERKLEIDQSVENNFGHICAKAGRSLDMLMIEAISSGADVETRKWITALRNKYQEMVSNGRDSLANGDYEVLLDEEGLENLRLSSERDIASVKSVVERQKTLDEARKEQERKSQETREVNAMADVQEAIKSTDDKLDSSEKITSKPTEQNLEESSEDDTEGSENKLGYFDRRNKQDALKVYSSIDRLIDSAIKAGHLSDEQRSRLEASAKSNRDAYDRLISGDYVPKRDSIKNSERFLEEIKDIIIIDKNNYGEPLSKDEQKRLKKIKK